MKKNQHTSVINGLKSRLVLAISSGMILASCGAQMGGYSETDGVYYDPETDTLPEGVILNETGNQVGDYYDYEDDTSVIEKSAQNMAERENRYDEWSMDTSTDSDWGAYAGSETNVYNDYWGYGFGSPWGWYNYNPYWNNGFGWGLGFGNSWGFGASWNWGSPWGWSRYNPMWGYYGPMGYIPNWNIGWGYNPYFNGYYGYNPYLYGGYYGNYNRVPYRRSGANGRMNNSMLNANKPGQTLTGSRNSGFRSARKAPANTRYQNARTISGDRNSTGTRTRYQSQPRPSNNNSGYRNTTPRTNTNVRSNNNGGFRSSGGFNSGSSSTRSSSGGFRSGGSSSGGSRSGGMRR